MKTETFVRKSFPIQAVRVTEENMVEVAAWCGGAIKSETQGKRTVTYVEVPVHRPMSERQKKAFVGDWVSFIGRSFKSYTQRAFDECFESPSEDQLTHFGDGNPLPGLEALAAKHAPGQV